MPVKWLALLLRIREAPGLVLRSEVGFHFNRTLKYATTFPYTLLTSMYPFDGLTYSIEKARHSTKGYMGRSYSKKTKKQSLVLKHQVKIPFGRQRRL
jgi:hypothetical protein